MSAFIPSRRDEEINRTALARVREDKGAEAELGFDGAWVAHPDLVPVVAEVFGARLGDRPEPEGPAVRAARDRRRACSTCAIPGGRVTEAGVRGNVSVALQYLEAWLRGSGAVAINNLMEDTATAEIARAQLWQWIRHGTADGVRTGDARRRRGSAGRGARRGTPAPGRWRDAAALLDALVPRPTVPRIPDSARPTRRSVTVRVLSAPRARVARGP